MLKDIQQQLWRAGKAMRALLRYVHTVALGCVAKVAEDDPIRGADLLSDRKSADLNSTPGWRTSASEDPCVAQRTVVHQKLTGYTALSTLSASSSEQVWLSNVIQT